MNGCGGERPFVKFLEDEGTVHLGLASTKPLGSTIHMCNRIRLLTLPLE
jgi:hypothetical protein